ncbi:MAG: 16S rRNA (cytosine(1402)-N(4))-methyltransferase RsmH [Thiotrichales bacterium]|nr:16S rRNA (cytosine(1402)-N(4))-methyltransferase RsmH [Thiotrichales bacterium]MCY4286930.1 16S rRNA (cytosine(1402)-N(4))-methyltransferase RsmH [Thiotrichales bacterium]MCY4348397.1 16S rRNA (cytosine(1402)-N(4))-methyltransferase RsmH [Thiotrichales bacterium]
MRHTTGGHGPEHVPVMLDEVVEAVAPRSGGIYVDCTFGRGGHSRAVLARIGSEGRVLAMDRDPQAVAVARELARCDPRLTAVHARFGTVAEVVDAAGLAGRVDAVLIDLGVSSPQLVQPERGFSFLGDGPLDMRMDPGVGVTAAQWLASASEREIARVLRDFGEERAARRIARAVVAERTRGAPIATTGRLAAVVAGVVRGGGPRTRLHPATRTFQAIRMHVNDEPGDLERGLAAMPEVLAPGGRLVVLSFHSIEDRMVKRFMRGDGTVPVLPRGLPVTHSARPCGPMTPIMPSRRPGANEVATNPRARSAVLRVAERSR